MHVSKIFFTTVVAVISILELVGPANARPPTGEKGAGKPLVLGEVVVTLKQSEEITRRLRVENRYLPINAILIRLRGSATVGVLFTPAPQGPSGSFPVLDFSAFWLNTDGREVGGPLPGPVR